MKLVLDTNVLFSVFWRGSLIKKLLLSDNELYSPEFALMELDNNKLEIIEKTKLTDNEFEEFKEKLKKAVKFVPFERYSHYISKAFEIMPEHQKDIDFLALALFLGAAILSKERRLKKQTLIKIYSDKDLAELL